MRSLRWGVKQSLIDYVRGMPDGRITVADGAEITDEGFAFPQVDDDRFRGTVTLVGHGGMMRILVSDPAIDRHGQEWTLSIADPDDPALRLTFATIRGWSAQGPDRRGAFGTALTAAGADLFFGPYVEGTPLDDPVIAD